MKTYTLETNLISCTNTFRLTQFSIRMLYCQHKSLGRCKGNSESSLNINNLVNSKVNKTFRNIYVINTRALLGVLPLALWQMYHCADINSTTTGRWPSRSLPALTLKYQVKTSNKAKITTKSDKSKNFKIKTLNADSPSKIYKGSSWIYKASSKISRVTNSNLIKQKSPNNTDMSIRISLMLMRMISLVLEI